MKTDKNFIDFLKNYNKNNLDRTEVDDFIEDTKTTYLWNNDNLSDNEIFEDLDSRKMCEEAYQLYNDLKIQYLKEKNM